ncbi:MAG: prolyl oligopeptidase family serine peptidase [Terrimonas sp.]|nr:prolyl oligopeptidase family serine peptidase [Terrimonas sp.]
MNIKYLLPAATLIFLSCNNPSSVKRTNYQWPVGVQAPVAKKIDTALVAHGDTRHDEYYWMNAFFKKGPKSDEVVKYLTEENNYLDTMMSGTKKLQEDLFAEMKGRIQEKDESVPAYQNGYFYYSRTEEGKQYFKYCRKKGSLDAPEEILLDADKMAEGHGYFSARGFSISPDNKLMAFGVDTVSRRQYVILVKNLETGELLVDQITNTGGTAVWANDNKTFFYTYNNPETLLSEKIQRHVLGKPVTDDKVVYQEKDPSNYIGVGKTRSRKYITIYSGGTLSSEIRLLNADNPDGEFALFQPRMKEVLYNVDHWGDRFLVTTNWNARNFKLMETPELKTGSEHWKDVIPHREHVLLEGVTVFKDFWVITEREEGLLKIRVRDMTTGNEHYLDFGEPAYAAYVGDNREYESGTLRYNYTSLTTPNSVYDYDMKAKTKQLKKEQVVLGGFDKNEYVTERVYATARDGVKVPVSIVYKKGFKKDGGSPLLLYGYGSYGASMDASFSSSRLSLLNRGFVYAIAHIRGGQEMGRQWYEDGKMMKKNNTFNDFIDCGRYLIDQQYTAKGHLYAQGGSAGGLLMGAVTNMAPDLWNGVIAQVPFVDVVTTMSDVSIPLTTNEFDEWGNPITNQEQYLYMKSYSPYDNVEKKDYPNLLVLTGLHDSQVQYFEPAKWVARLRAMKTDDHLLLLKTNMKAGHGGASGRFDYLKDVALEYAFLMALEGIPE